ncbi:hypothetical protein DTO169E5_2178 [Paecilomyces variotii]|nr:hypothetical protein DTO169E5_2178 [Paecilomyces variotii]
MPEAEPGSVIPAQLSFLAIYNPLLGTSEETLADQIVFYFSKAAAESDAFSDSVDTASSARKDERDVKLRQIGLAQGMVSFARNFSTGEALDSVETERSLIVLHELEKNWWILASVDLTRLPSNSNNGSSSTPNDSRFDYSSREVSPPHLLVQQLRRAHSIFLLHHGTSLDELYSRVGRETACRFLDRFWTRFAWTWGILLNGNPAAEIYNGIKLAAGGELGIGVGEEEWGSGEREVLEDFVYRTDGLLDLVVSRFGDAVPPTDGPDSPKKKNGSSDVPSNEYPWLGSDTCPRPSDGVIFSGVGAISRESLIQVSQWMEWIYRYGEAAYGVNENPSSLRRRKRRRRQLSRHIRDPSGASGTQMKVHRNASRGGTPIRDLSPGIPPPLVALPPQPIENASTNEASRDASRSRSTGTETPDDSSGFGTDTVVKYLTLGYGSSWGFPSLSLPSHPRLSILRQSDGSGSEAGQSLNSSTTRPATPSDRLPREEKRRSPADDAVGKFIIGLRDDLEDEDSDDEDIKDGNAQQSTEEKVPKNGRTMLRTLHVRMATASGDKDTQDISSEEVSKKLQVVVYVHRPFMFTFLFELRTPTLAYPTFYRSIHHQLGPLQKPLLSSTSPENVSQRISTNGAAAASSRRPSAPKQPIYDLVYDPSNRTIRSSIPNIPDPGVFVAEGPSDMRPWSRLEALNVHQRILATYSETLLRPLDMERTCKTNRSWWVTWVRIPHSEKGTAPEQGTAESESFKSAFLIRKASDYATTAGHSRASSGSRFFRDLSGTSSLSPSGLSSMTSGKLAEGVGLDPRRYIESLLSLNR